LETDERCIITHSKKMSRFSKTTQYLMQIYIDDIMIKYEFY